MISSLNFSKNIDLFQKVKNLFRQNLLKQHTQWLSYEGLCLISIKSEQVSKVCLIVKSSSQPMHTGGSSPFNKNE